MVSENILSMYMGSEVVVRLQGNTHATGILEEMDSDSVLLVMGGGATDRIKLSEIKGIERKPEGHADFEKKVNFIIEQAISAGEAKNEREALELLKKRMSR